MTDEVEDVWTIVQERNGLRAKVRQLERENRRLRVIIDGYARRLSRVVAEPLAAPVTQSPAGAGLTRE